LCKEWRWWGVLGWQIASWISGPLASSRTKTGNSVRGISTLKMLSCIIGLNAFDLTNTGSRTLNSFFEPEGKQCAKTMYVN
jgi:hypothetical protein